MRSIGLLSDVPTPLVFNMLPLSPKRKREPSESDCYSPTASPTSPSSIASYQAARFREEDNGLESCSPRTAVAGRFGELAIRGDCLSDLGALTGDSQRRSPISPARKIRETGDYGRENAMPEALPPTSREPTDGQALLLDPPVSTTRSPTRKKAASFTRKSLKPSSPSKRKQRLSSPLAEVSSEADPLVWHDSEITGHNPSDPSDDGYGINGVGFKPTASLAWERSQKRQKQVAEWKTREAREARERRRERRGDGLKLDKLREIKDDTVQKRVKFNI